jgi:transposase InsO family protein
MGKLNAAIASMRKNFGVGFAPAAEALLAWERRYNHERFSMALHGLTPAEKLATFTASQPPEQSVLTHHHDLAHGATS